MWYLYVMEENQEAGCCEILAELHSGFFCDTSQPDTVMGEAQSRRDVLAEGQPPSQPP